VEHPGGPGKGPETADKTTAQGTSDQPPAGPPGATGKTPRIDSLTTAGWKFPGRPGAADKQRGDLGSQSTEEPDDTADPGETGNGGTEAEKPGQTKAEDPRQDEGEQGNEDRESKTGGAGGQDNTSTAGDKTDDPAPSEQQSPLPADNTAFPKPPSRLESLARAREEQLQAAEQLRAKFQDVQAPDGTGGDKRGPKAQLPATEAPPSGTDGDECGEPPLEPAADPPQPADGQPPSEENNPQPGPEGGRPAKPATPDHEPDRDASLFGPRSETTDQVNQHREICTDGGTTSSETGDQKPAEKRAPPPEETGEKAAPPEVHSDQGDNRGKDAEGDGAPGEAATIEAETTELQSAIDEELADGDAAAGKPTRLEGRRDYVVDDPAVPGRTIIDIDRIQDGVLWEEKSATSAGDIERWVAKHIDKKFASYLDARQYMADYESAPIGFCFTSSGADPAFRSGVESAVERLRLAHPGEQIMLEWS
jgi:hypothetical protein